MTLRGGDREAARATPRLLTEWGVTDVFPEAGCNMGSRFGRECDGFISEQLGLEDWMQGPRAEGSTCPVDRNLGGRAVNTLRRGAEGMVTQRAVQ